MRKLRKGRPFQLKGLRKVNVGVRREKSRKDS